MICYAPLVSGDVHILGVQCLAVLIVMVYTAVVTSVILIILKNTPHVGLRSSLSKEDDGMDTTYHCESAYASASSPVTAARTLPAVAAPGTSPTKLVHQIGSSPHSPVSPQSTEQRVCAPQVEHSQSQ